MPIPLYLVKTDCPPHDQLRLLDAWEDWGVSREQQWQWVAEIFGVDHVNDLADYLTYEILGSKEDQLELPFTQTTDDLTPSVLVSSTDSTV